MKKAPLVSLILVLVLILVSCRIEKRVYRPGYYVEFRDKPKGNINHIRRDFLGYTVNAYDALASKPSCEKVIDPSIENVIMGDEGTYIEIPENAFEMANGTPLKCTSVIIVLKEYYTNADILAAGLTTTANKKMLSSGGMIYIEANCSEEKLVLKQGKHIKIYMPTDTPEKGMHLFAGNLKDGIIDWNIKGKATIVNGNSIPQNNYNYPDNSNSGEPNLSYDSVETEMGEVFVAVYEGEYEGESMGAQYLLESAQLGWINCDKFYDTDQKVNLIVKADSIEKSFVALVFKNIKSVLPGYAYSNKVVEFTSIPKGEEVSIIVYRVDKKNNTAWYGTQDLVIGDTSNVRLDLMAMDIGDFKQELKNFNY